MIDNLRKLTDDAMADGMEDYGFAMHNAANEIERLQSLVDLWVPKTNFQPDATQMHTMQKIRDGSPLEPELNGVWAKARFDLYET